MEKYILLTRLIENPNVVFYCKGIANELNLSKALDNEIALEKSEAMKIDRATAQKLCNELNAEKDLLKEKGFSEFEILTVGLSPFKEASRYAVSKINHKEMYYAFGIMEENRCNLDMVGNSTQDEMREYLNEWGAENNLDEDWFEKYGDEEEALFLGYEILSNENKFIN